MLKSKLQTKGDGNIIFPKGEIRILTYYPENSNGKCYIVTRDKARKYYLYLKENDKMTKLKTSDDPTDFKEVYP